MFLLLQNKSRDFKLHAALRHPVGTQVGNALLKITTKPAREYSSPLPAQPTHTGLPVQRGKTADKTFKITQICVM